MVQMKENCVLHCSVMIRWQQQQKQLYHLFSPEPVVTEAWAGLERQRGTA